MEFISLFLSIFKNSGQINLRLLFGMNFEPFIVHIENNIFAGIWTSHIFVYMPGPTAVNLLQETIKFEGNL